MPKLNDAMETHALGGTAFSFSAVRVDALAATEYTLAVLAVDTSGSVAGHADRIERMVQQVVKSCRRSPRADNLMLRVIHFNNDVREIHGFRPLPECNEDDYRGTVKPSGLTALNDAAYTAVSSAESYGRALTLQDFGVNAAVFVITDGAENHSRMPASKVAQAVAAARKSEALESITTVLIGVDTDATTGLNAYLEKFKADAGFQQYAAIDAVDEKSLAKLADFVSRSISSQSQALGTGGPSQALTF